MRMRYEMKYQFSKNQKGATAAEFTMVFAIFWLLFMTIFDFGRMLFDFNKAAKATELGVRLAVVSDIVATGLQGYDGLGAAGGNGLPVPIAAINPNPVICNSDGCNGYGPLDTAAFNLILSRMQALDSHIQAENLEIIYQHIGLGFSGNPFGPDIAPLVTVRLRNMTFDFILPGFQTVSQWTMPSFTSTLTGEDLSSS